MIIVLFFGGIDVLQNINNYENAFLQTLIDRDFCVNYLSPNSFQE